MQGLPLNTGSLLEVLLVIWLETFVCEFVFCFMSQSGALDCLNLPGSVIWTVEPFAAQVCYLNHMIQFSIIDTCEQ
jgi:hypothetical protein